MFHCTIYHCIKWYRKFWVLFLFSPIGLAIFFGIVSSIVFSKNIVFQHHFVQWFIDQPRLHIIVQLVLCKLLSSQIIYNSTSVLCKLLCYKYQRKFDDVTINGTRSESKFRHVQYEICILLKPCATSIIPVFSEYYFIFILLYYTLRF